ncbi:MAG: hypothetical protein ACE5KT_01585 [Methanosarcinales archaeon]
MAKKELTEEEMLEIALRNPKLRRIWGALKDIIPEAVEEYQRKYKHEKDTTSSRD